ncbi:signal recognition particle receptor subunit alpha-like [Lytechinus variegatus]|uniref:signal recognition particle receptor subunit alpha-like n=1 Tax=Lytechinus variegatus TaxID=7654 RepID=UPI001BB0DED0|nr:signal recognition particle receptor subunit alpha-like [Lytechinus variegatus]
MLDLFTIFSKGGIVLWCFQGTCQAFGAPVNSLIKSVILQERGGSNSFSHGTLTLKCKLDNEFELIFVVAYQNILSLAYIDKFIDDIHREFRDKYKEELKNGRIFGQFDFSDDFQRVLKEAEKSSVVAKKGKQMKTFEESHKSKKTVGSMIIDTSKEEKNIINKTKKGGKTESSPQPAKKPVKQPETNDNGSLDEETIRRNREKLFNRNKPKKQEKSPKVTSKPTKKPKVATTWGMGGNAKDMDTLDWSEKPPSTNGTGDKQNGDKEFDIEDESAWVGTMKGELPNIDGLNEGEGEEEEEEEEEEEIQTASKPKAQSKTGSRFGMFNMFRGLVGSKTLDKQTLTPVLDKMRDHLTAKNVARDIAEKLCESVATKLEGKVLGTFERVTSVVKEALQESLVQILSPRRRVDILRDALDSKAHNKPFSITFCGVNGVGKSTNLAKICFWLIENGFRVLIAACDTFRAGAVEQLRTHMRHLNALHPAEKHGGHAPVQLYEKGYGKDAAGIAMEAIKFARDYRFDVVLIDTAGRMQDNEPLMRALSKLIKVNRPDLVLFVGEALVGNEAVDQLTKFNRALADFSDSDDPRLIDGIVLTKFDTIDDKVGAAISMTYTTGQPIVFVGTGQTYRDLRNLNVQAVVNALLKA